MSIDWLNDAIQPAHPLSSPSPPTFSLSQHEDLFKWVSSLHQVAKVLEFQLQHQFLPMNTQDWSHLGLTGWISLQSKGLSRVFSSTTVQKHHSSVLSFLCSPHPPYLPDLLPTWYHFFKHLENFFFRENTSTTSRRQKMLSKSSSNPEAQIFMLQE